MFSLNEVPQSKLMFFKIQKIILASICRHDIIYIYIYIYMYMCIYIYIYIYILYILEVAIQSWPKRDLNPRPLKSDQTL